MKKPPKDPHKPGNVKRGLAEVQAAAPFAPRTFATFLEKTKEAATQPKETDLVDQPVKLRPPSDARFEQSATILEAFVKDYCDMPVWADVIDTSQFALKTYGRHLPEPPPFGIKEAIAVLVERYGEGAILTELGYVKETPR